MKPRRCIAMVLCLAGCLTFAVYGGGCTCAGPADDMTTPDDTSDGAQQVFDDIQDVIDDNLNSPDGDSELAARLEAFLIEARACLTGPAEDPLFLPPNAICIEDFDTDGDGDIDEIDVIERFADELGV